MPWNDLTNVLTAPFTKIAANGQGDLQKALGSSLMSQIRLFTEPWINPMAKYKPFRNAAPVFATDAARNTARQNARYGFATPIPTLNLTQNIPANNWVYQRPRGGSNNEPFRALDFIKTIAETRVGYDRYAGTPLAMMVGQLVYDAQSQILLFAEDKSNAIRQDGRVWVADRSLSLAELLESKSDYYGYYISFLLIDTSDGNYTKNLIVTNTTVRSFVSASYNYKEFDIYAEQTTESGLVHPAVPILSSSRAGHYFTIVACILPGNQPPSGYAYAVYTNTTTPAVATLTPYSLGFTDGCDRISVALDSGEFKMDGTQITSIPVIATDTAIEETVSGQVFRAYALEIRAVVSTANAAAYSGTKGISGTLTFNTSGMFGPTASSAGSLAPQGVHISGLASKTSGQSKIMWSSGGTNYMWLPKVNGSVVRTSLQLSVVFDYPFRTGQEATGQTTVYIPY